MLQSLPMCLHVFNDNFVYSIDFTDLQIGDLKSILIILTILKTAMGQVRQLSDTVLSNLSDYTNSFDAITDFCYSHLCLDIVAIVLQNFVPFKLVLLHFIPLLENHHNVYYSDRFLSPIPSPSWQY